MLLEDVDISSILTEKEGLNGKLFEQGGLLKPEVREHMLKIANEYYKFLKITTKIIDIYFTGSMANYNWTKSSDIDIHIILEGEDDDLLTNYLFAKKHIWSDTHNITIKQAPVEIFAKTSGEKMFKYKSVYSLWKNRWIVKPTRNNQVIEKEVIQDKANELAQKIDDLESVQSLQEKADEAEKIKERLRLMRDAGLESGGEFSNENLIFKVLRNSGYLEKLGNIKTKALDAELSLKEINEGFIPEQEKALPARNEDGTLNYGCLMLGVKVPQWKEILSEIEPKDIYDKPGFGLQKKTPHITLLFGFHDNEVDAINVLNTAKKYIKKQTPVYCTGISCFSNEDKPYDVVKIDVVGDVLAQVNSVMKETFPYTNEFPDYHAHLAVAYVKKGKGKNYCYTFSEPMLIYTKDILYSRPDKSKEVYNLPKVNVIKVEDGIQGMDDKKLATIKDFVNFTCSKLDMENPVKVVLMDKKDGKKIVTTASYMPSTDENFIRCGNRAVVDICRSIAHELTHNKQREIGKFKPGDEIQNIGGAIEDEANSIAGILIKDFALNYGKKEIYD